MQCAKCYTGNAAGDDRCRSCGAEIAVDPAVKQERELARKAAEINELKARVAAKKERDERDASYAEALKMSDAELEDLRVQAADA